MSWKYWDEYGEHDWVNPDDPLPVSTSPIFLFKSVFLNQFVDAINERVRLCYPIRLMQGNTEITTVDSVSIGDDVQGKSLYAGWWSKIASMCVISANTYDAVFPIITGSMPSTLPRWTVATLAASIGIQSSGSTLLPRQYRGEEFPATYEYSEMRAGDIIGPWVFEDLRKAIARIRYFIGMMQSMAGHQAAGIAYPITRKLLDPATTGSGYTYAAYVTEWNARSWVPTMPSDTFTVGQSALLRVGTGSIRLLSDQIHVRPAWKYHASAGEREYTYGFYMYATSPGSVGDGYFRDDDGLGLTDGSMAPLFSGTHTSSTFYDYGSYFGIDAPLPDTTIHRDTWGFVNPELDSPSAPRAMGWVVLGTAFEY